MIFTETPLKGAFIIDLDRKADDRGYFARMFCSKEFEQHGLNPTVTQCNLSFNHHQGTLRGMHYQIPPAAETKLVRCIRGAIYDVIIDLRSDSLTYLQYVAVELTPENGRSLYVPELFAHGYQTLTDDTEVMYAVSEFYTPNCERGVRYNDPAFNIEWQLPIRTISEKDASWALYEPVTLGVPS